MEFLLVYILIAVAALVWHNRKRPARWYRFQPQTQPQPVVSHDEQLAAVTNAQVTFVTKPILLSGEYRAYKAAQRVLKKHNREDYYLWAQVCMGELFAPKSHDAWIRQEAQYSINSKRSDIVLTDSKGHALALIEYQGRQHYQGTAHKRDTIKRLVAQRAGVLFLEIHYDWSDAQIEQALEKGLQHLMLPIKK